MSKDNLSQPIMYPEIRIKNGYRKEHKVLVDRFFEQYNANKESRDQLKAPHKQMLLELLYYSYIVVERDAKALAKDGVLNAYNSDSHIRIDLNRFTLANEFFKHPDTIKRHKKRLIEAGALIASREKFEELKVAKNRRNQVLINPDLVLIYDRFNPEYQPTSPYLSATELEELRGVKRAKYIGVTGTVPLLEQCNNVIMPVHDVKNSKGVSHPVNNLHEASGHNSNKELTRTPPILSGFVDNSNSENVKKDNKITDLQHNNKNTNTEVPPGDVKNLTNKQECATITDKVTHLRRSLAIDFYAFMVQMLFKFHNIYPNESINAIDYIEDYYFRTVTDEEQGVKVMKQYKWRLSKAASYNNRKNIDFSNVYPCNYLNINNPKGFTATRAWFNKHLTDQARKAHEKAHNQQRIVEEIAIKQALQRYLSAPTYANYKNEMKQISTNIPHRLNDFIQQAIN